MVRALPKMPVLSTRGTAVSPTSFHNVPSDMMICGPRCEEARMEGVIRANPALNGIGGNLTRPLITPRSRSTMLMLSPPVFPTYRETPSVPNASVRGQLPHLDGREQPVGAHVEDFNAIESGISDVEALSGVVHQHVHQALAVGGADRDGNHVALGIGVPVVLVDAHVGRDVDGLGGLNQQIVRGHRSQAARGRARKLNGQVGAIAGGG